MQCNNCRERPGPVRAVQRCVQRYGTLGNIDIFLRRRGKSPQGGGGKCAENSPKNHVRNAKLTLEQHLNMMKQLAQRIRQAKAGFAALLERLCIAHSLRAASGAVRK